MVDLIVRGAGVLGLTVAWEAAKRGLKVCISDPNGIASMASGGIVGALAPHVPGWRRGANAMGPKMAHSDFSL